MPRPVSRFFLGDVVSTRAGRRPRAVFLAITSWLSARRAVVPHERAAAPVHVTTQTYADGRGACRRPRRGCAAEPRWRRGAGGPARFGPPVVARRCSPASG